MDDCRQRGGQVKIVMLPRKVWIGSYEFPIHLVEPSDPRMRTGDDLEEGNMLSGDPEFAILLANNLGMLRRLEILKHEITHAINWSEDIDEDEKPILEETIATKQGRAWAAFYLDNPQYLAWLVYTVGRIIQDRKQKTKEPDVPAKRTETAGRATAADTGAGKSSA